LFFSSKYPLPKLIPRLFVSISSLYLIRSPTSRPQASRSAPCLPLPDCVPHASCFRLIDPTPFAFPSSHIRISATLQRLLIRLPILRYSTASTVEVEVGIRQDSAPFDLSRLERHALLSLARQWLLPASRRSRRILALASLETRRTTSQRYSRLLDIKTLPTVYCPPQSDFDAHTLVRMTLYPRSHKFFDGSSCGFFRG
jgi:hypothetical protein